MKAQSQRTGRKLPASTTEKLQQDRFALEERVRQLEAELREERGKKGEADTAREQHRQDSAELSRLRREKSRLELDLKKAQDEASRERNKYI